MATPNERSSATRSARRWTLTTSFKTGVRYAGPPLATFGVLLTLWHGVVVAFEVPPIVLPGPVAVGRALVTLHATLLADAAITGSTALLGLTGGCAVGALLAFAMTYSRAASRTLLPYVIALRIAPLVAIAPLVFLWFGRGVAARGLLVATLALFPMTIATLDGLRSTPDRYLALMDSVAASPLAVFVRVRIPAAAPSVFAGLKLAATLSVIGAVVAEFVTLRGGLGYRVFVTATRLDTAESFAALAVLSALGVVFYLGPVAIERFAWPGDAEP